MQSRADLPVRWAALWLGSDRDYFLYSQPGEKDRNKEEKLHKMGIIG